MDSAAQLAALRAEMEALKADSPSSAPSPSPVSHLSASAQQLAALQAEMAALNGTPAPSLAVEPAASNPSASAQQLAALRAEMEALNASEAPKQAGLSDSARQLAQLQEQLRAMKEETAAPPPQESASARELAALQAQLQALRNPPKPAEPKMTDSQRQIAELKAQLEAMKNAGSPPPKPAEPQMTESQRQIAQLKAQIEAMKNAGSPPPKPAEPVMTESQRQIAQLKAQIEAMKNAGSPPPKPAEPVMTESQRQIAQLKAQIDAMKNGGSPPPKPVEPQLTPTERELAALRTELERLRNPQAGNGGGLTKTERQIALLKEQLGDLKKQNEPSPSTPTPTSESQRQIAQLKAELAALSGATDPKKITESKQQVLALQDELARLRAETDKVDGESTAELDKLKEEMQALVDEIDPSLDTDPDVLARERELEKLRQEVMESNRRAQLQADELARIKKISGGTSLDEAQKRLNEKRAEHARKQKGLDLCLIMDATVSMKKFIEQCQQTLLKIFDEAQKISGGVVRVAFIAYRDHGLKNQFEWMDFKSNGAELEELRSCIAAVKASTIILAGGDVDPPEDVAGAFEHVKSFSWKSNTRLIFHVADAPCHGNKYHDCRWTDNFPGGDPKFDPEEAIRYFARDRIDYYFLRLDDYTDIMCKKFEKAYRDEVGMRGNFEVIDNGAAVDPQKFLPAVIQSLTASCRAV